MSYLSDMLTRSRIKLLAKGLLSGADNTTLTSLISSVSASGRPAITKTNWKFVVNKLKIGD